MKKRADPWFKCFPADWIEATRSLTPEQRGIYFDCLCLIYQYGKPLPDDDKWVSHQLHISTRLWRSVRDALVAAGKLVKTAEGYMNERAKIELESRSEQARNNAEIAANRERAKREKSEKDNKINETQARNEHHARALQNTDNRIQKENIPTERYEQDAAREEAHGFDGKLIHLSAKQVRELEQSFPKLCFPGDLIAADRFLATQINGHAALMTWDAKFARLTTYLARRNREAREIERDRHTPAALSERSRRINEMLRRQFQLNGASA